MGHFNPTLTKVENLEWAGSALWKEATPDTLLLRRRKESTSQACVINPAHSLHILMYYPFPLLNHAHCDAPGAFQEICTKPFLWSSSQLPSMSSNVTIDINLFHYFKGYFWNLLQTNVFLGFRGYNLFEQTWLRSITSDPACYFHKSR